MKRLCAQKNVKNGTIIMIQVLRGQGIKRGILSD